jgi:homoserine dehydrogenase
MGIVNGTTNYILDRMDTEGADFADVLAQAQELGYAEADPTADVEGYDAAQKAAILASLAFHTTVPLDAVHREGITSVDAAMIESARHAGYVIKLLAVCERLAAEDGGTESISVRVYPALVERTHPLASVHGANNAVFVQAEAAGDLMFYGAGAGGVQTASAVLGDVVSAARRHIAGGVGVGESTRANLPAVPIGRVITRYQITLEVDDKPGVLATVAGILSEGRVSIATVEQTVIEADENTQTSGSARLVIGTHKAREQDLSETVERLAASGVVERVVSVLRVEGN